jgi:uncharacterized protein
LSALINNSALTIIISAFSFGLLSSLHCISMCGPLVSQTSNSAKGHFLYQCGRLISYLILGFILFFLASNLFNSISKTIQEFSLYFLILLYFYVGIKIWFKKSDSFVFSSFFSKKYKKYFQRILKSKNKSTVPFLMGLISALLPCGLLHTFLLGVIPIKSPLIVFFYISSFWLATSPVLIGVNFSLRKLKGKININSPKLVGLFYIIMGGYLIYIRYFNLLPHIKCH